MGKHRKLAALVAQLDALYARLPPIVCAKQCAAACGPIILSDLEARRLQAATHQAPRVVNGTRCVYLTPQGKCRAYAARPLICRAYGLLKSLSCPYGCVPAQWLRDTEFVAIAQAVERLGGGRILQTTADGLVVREGDTFASIIPTRDEAAIDADAERTRSARALHGGRIIAVVGTDQ